MVAPLVVVTGTGTGVGKTHAAVALTIAWARRGGAIAAWKPIESGVADGLGPDGAALQQVSTFHVKHSASTYPAPVSPHLASRLAGQQVPLGQLQDNVDDLRQHAAGVLIELAGGLFTPLSDRVLTAAWVRDLAPTRTLLVAPNRLGVLHEVLATQRAAAATGLTIDAILLSDPPDLDASSSTNSQELPRFVDIPVWDLPRTDARTLADHLAPTFALLLAGRRGG